MTHEANETCQAYPGNMQQHAVNPRTSDQTPLFQQTTIPNISDIRLAV